MQHMMSDNSVGLCTAMRVHWKGHIPLGLWIRNKNLPVALGKVRWKAPSLPFPRSPAVPPAPVPPWGFPSASSYNLKVKMWMCMQSVAATFLLPTYMQNYWRNLNG